MSGRVSARTVQADLPLTIKLGNSVGRVRALGGRLTGPTCHVDRKERPNQKPKGRLRGPIMARVGSPMRQTGRG